MARARGINSEDTLAVIFERRGGREGEGTGRKQKKDQTEKDGNREVKIEGGGRKKMKRKKEECKKATR